MACLGTAQAQFRHAKPGTGQQQIVHLAFCQQLPEWDKPRARAMAAIVASIQAALVSSCTSARHPYFGTRLQRPES